MMSNQMEWCKHIKGEYFQHTDNSGRYCPTTNFKFCPICAAPRPSEPKTLAEKLQEDALSRSLSCGVFAEHINKLAWEQLAEVAEQHFLSQLEGKEAEEALVDLFHYKECGQKSLYLARSVMQFIKERIS